MFDPGATHSFISSACISGVPIKSEVMVERLIVDLPMGESVICDRVLRGCEFNISEVVLKANLIPIPLKVFDVILGMDTLSVYQAVVDCYQKTIQFMIGQIWIQFKGDCVSASTYLISAATARRMLRKGCEAYLAYVVDTEKSQLKIEDIPVVNEFIDVFPDELPGLPPERVVDFAIDLQPGTTPISRAPYRMAPVELQELKV